MYNYEIIIYWSKEDDSYIAEVPELAGCMSDGKTLHEVVENVQEVIREWIQVAVEEGRDIPTPKGKLAYA